MHEMHRALCDSKSKVSLHIFFSSLPLNDYIFLTLIYTMKIKNSNNKHSNFLMTKHSILSR